MKHLSDMSCDEYGRLFPSPYLSKCVLILLIGGLFLLTDFMYMMVAINLCSIISVIIGSKINSVVIGNKVLKLLPRAKLKKCKLSFNFHTQIISSHWISIICDVHCREEISANYIVETNF